MRRCMQTDVMRFMKLLPASGKALLPVIFAASATGWAGQVPPMPGSASGNAGVVLDSHMPEASRSAIKKLVVVGGVVPAGDAVTGTYDEDTGGLAGGMNEGGKIGTISKEVGGVPVNIPIPYLGMIGSIFGGLSGAAKEQMQDLRDAMTEELMRADNPPLRSDGLALDAYRAIQRLPAIESDLFSPSKPLPEGTDAAMYVNFDGLTIDVQDDDAIITAAATATLRRLSDGVSIYGVVVKYQDRDSLSNWTENENALWHEYINFARYYLGREIAAEFFDRVELNHELKPVETNSAEQDRKNKLKFVSESLTPTLAWELKLNGGDAYGSWPESIDESGISYDIEIFDNQQLAYYEKQVPDPSHTLAYELEPCKTYRWSVRPVYQVGSDIRFGEWMKFTPETDKDDEEVKTVAEKGIFGRQASTAPAYIQDFALLETECKRK